MDKRSSQVNKVAEATHIAGWTFLGISLLDVQMALQFLAVVLGIIATCFTIHAHIKRLLEERKERRK